jgi:hypothetical protein
MFHGFSFFYDQSSCSLVFSSSSDRLTEDSLNTPSAQGRSSKRHFISTIPTERVPLYEIQMFVREIVVVVLHLFLSLSS